MLFNQKVLLPGYFTILATPTLVPSAAKLLSALCSLLVPSAATLFSALCCYTALCCLKNQRNMENDMYG
ncbi:hypothetical protein V6Z11_A12G032300 [Gossypium hirsutum]